jgi:hypothetical protein
MLCSVEISYLTVVFRVNTCLCLADVLSDLHRNCGQACCCKNNQMYVLSVYLNIGRLEKVIIDLLIILGFRIEIIYNNRNERNIRGTYSI